MPIRLAEYQLRLLLCTPSEKIKDRLHWACGCSASACGRRKYAIAPCEMHAVLLREVREDDEPAYDSFSAPTLQYPSGRPA